MSPSVQETIENYHASDDFAMLYCYIVIQIKLNVLVVALLLSDEFGEFATLATFVKFPIFATCKGCPLFLCLV